MPSPSFLQPVIVYFNGPLQAASSLYAPWVLSFDGMTPNDQLCVLVQAVQSPVVGVYVPGLYVQGVDSSNNRVWRLALGFQDICVSISTASPIQLFLNVTAEQDFASGTKVWKNGQAQSGNNIFADAHAIWAISIASSSGGGISTLAGAPDYTTALLSTDNLSIASAFTAANTASAAANTKATTALTNATAAQTTANSAVTTATAAQSTVTTALTNAASAQTAASSAVTTATTAATNASTALTNASTALTNAATAQTTASSASTAAAAAQTTATTAVTNAATAQTTANAAATQTSLNTTNSNITALNTVVTNKIPYAANWAADTNVVTGVAGLSSLANSSPGTQTAFQNTTAGTTSVAYLGSITSVSLNDVVMWNTITSAWQLMPFSQSLSAAPDYTTNLVTPLAGKVSSSLVGAASGVASLDSGGKVPVAQLPAAVQGALNYQGSWNATSNSPTLVSSTGTKGTFYTVGTAGTTALDGISQWNVGDHAAYNGTVWEKFDGVASEVISVAGRTGVVTIATTDLTDVASAITTPLATLNTAVASNTTAIATKVSTSSIGISGGVAPNGDTVQITGNVTITTGNQATYNGKLLEWTGAYTVTISAGLATSFGFAGIPPSSGNATIASDGTALLNGSTSSTNRSNVSYTMFAVAQRSTSTNSYVIN